MGRFEHGRSSFDDHVRDNDKDNDPRDRAGQKTQCTKHDCLVGNRMAQLLKDCHQGRNEIQALTKRPLLRADGVVIEQHEPAERINRDVYWISHPIDPTPRRCCVAWRSTTACTDRDKLS